MPKLIYCSVNVASSSGNTEFFQLRKGSKEITGDRKMVRWDIEGYIGIQLNFRKNDRGVFQAPPHYFRSANSISQSKYCVKACNFRII